LGKFLLGEILGISGEIGKFGARNFWGEISKKFGGKFLIFWGADFLRKSVGAIFFGGGNSGGIFEKFFWVEKSAREIQKN